MKSNSNSVSSLQYHIVWCTKYRHPILTGAVEVETKTVLAQTCTEYGWTLKAIEVMPDHVHLLLYTSSRLSRSLRNASSGDLGYGPVAATTEASVPLQKTVLKSTSKTRSRTSEVPNDEMPDMWQGYGQRSCHIFKQHALQHKCHVQT